jgi:hypothetical protein
MEPCSPIETGSASFHNRPDCAHFHLPIADQDARTGCRLKGHRRVIVVKPTDHPEYQPDIPVSRNGKTVIHTSRRLRATDKSPATVREDERAPAGLGLIRLNDVDLVRHNALPVMLHLRCSSVATGEHPKDTHHQAGPRTIHLHLESNLECLAPELRRSSATITRTAVASRRRRSAEPSGDSSEIAIFFR